MKKHMRSCAGVVGVFLGTILALQSLALSEVSAQQAPLQGSVIDQGLSSLAQDVNLPTTSGNVREPLTDALNFLVSFVTLAAVVAVIVAGFFLILGGGSDSAVQRAKKIIIYAIIGIIVIFLSRVIVGFFTQELPRWLL